jgi:hypothetical protein
MKNQFAMNQVFSARRWGMFMVLHWQENRKRYLLAVPAMLGLLLVWYSFILLMDKFDPMAGFMQYTTYYAGLFFVGCLYSSTIFSELGNKAQGIAYLSIPVSTLERLLCGVFFSTVAFFIVYNLVYYAVDIPMVHLANRLIERQHRVWPGGYPVDRSVVFNAFRGMTDNFGDRNYHIFLISYFVIQSTFMLGSVYFSRYAFIKTSVAVFLLMLVFMIIQSRVFAPSLPNGWHYRDFVDWERNSDTPLVQAVRLSPVLSAVLGVLLKYGIPLAIWVATYFRLKEKEV